jgi:arylsulfatase
MRLPGWTVAAVSTWAAVAPTLADAQQTDRPNIILIITDDQGYGDLSCHGNPVLKTPNLDALHAASVRFTRFHVSPTCAPTRCALLTGRHEFRSGVTHTINERERMNPAAITYAQVLKTAGYSTGIFGKWHLGDEDAYQPDRRGFDEVFIHGGGGIGQAYNGSCADAPANRYFNPAIRHNGKFVKTEGYCTDVFFAAAQRWIEQRKDKGPFYAHIATNAPHSPLDCPEKYERMFTGKVPPDAAKFFGMIVNIDENVGRLLDRLREWKMEENTVVVFMTDNGGTAGVPVFNAGMRAGKNTPYSGGTRVPLFVRRPGKFAPRDVPHLAAHVDLYATFCELAGATLPAPVVRTIEGRSLVPLLKSPEAAWADRTLVTHLGRWPAGRAADSKYAGCSIRNSRFHMVSAAKGGAKAWQLFDLQSDPAEKADVIDKFPEAARELEAAYDRWWESVLPQLVNENVPNPTYRPYWAHYKAQFGSLPELPPEKTKKKKAGG